MENQTNERCVFVVGKAPHVQPCSLLDSKCVICGRVFPSKMVKCETCHLCAHDFCILTSSRIIFRQQAAEKETQTATVSVRHMAVGTDVRENKPAKQTQISVGKSADLTKPEIQNSAPAAILDDLKQPQTSIKQTNSVMQSFKFWEYRFTLFSQFDKGIMLNKESFQQVCPEILARRIAMKCNNFELILNLFCGTGSMAIQLALCGHNVIAVDSDPENILLAKKNAMTYGVADRIFFRLGDGYKVFKQVNANVIVTSLPWGNRINKSELDANAKWSSDKQLSQFLKFARSITTRVVLNVGENIDCDKFLQFAKNEGFSRIKKETVSIDDNFKFFTFYLTHDRDVHYAERGVKLLPTMNKDVYLKTLPLLYKQKMLYLKTNRIASFQKYIRMVEDYLDENVENHYI